MPPEGAATQVLQACGERTRAVEEKLIPFACYGPRRFRGESVLSLQDVLAVAAGKPRIRPGWEVQKTRGTN
jgi:hypothetical protein